VESTPDIPTASGPTSYTTVLSAQTACSLEQRMSLESAQFKADWDNKKF